MADVERVAHQDEGKDRKRQLARSRKAIGLAARACAAAATGITDIPDFLP
jgi:hypothetical protein